MPCFSIMMYLLVILVIVHADKLMLYLLISAVAICLQRSFRAEFNVELFCHLPAHRL
jgi:hypothetical protein